MAMSAEERQQMLLTQPVEKIIPKMALPTICSMLITSIYNMADTYFVSQIGTAEATASGTSASAAVGIVFSVMAMIQALAFMFGMGSGTNVSHLLGMGKRKEAEVYSAVGFFSAVAAGVLIELIKFELLTQSITWSPHHTGNRPACPLGCLSNLSGHTFA